MTETVRLTPEEERARKRRSLWIALALGAFMALVFFVTIARMQAGVAAGPS
jgi:thiol:disulfide interchange protein